MKLNVLDHGFVRLVSVHQPVPQVLYEFDSLEARHTSEIVGYRRDKNWTGDLEIVRNARVSHDADWRTFDNVEHEELCLSLLPPMSNGEKRDCNCKPRVRSDQKLIEYMMTHGHTSPFEALVFTFEVKLPIFIARQWHRHRTWSYNEVSARYAPLPSEFYVPRPEHIGNPDYKNRQGRSFSPFHRANPHLPDGLAELEEKDRVERLVETFRIKASEMHQIYNMMLTENVPREIARTILPLSTYTRMFATVDLHNLMHFLRLRLHTHAQWEIQQYAQALLRLVSPVCPIAIQTFIRTLNPAVYAIPAELDQRREEPSEKEFAGQPPNEVSFPTPE